MIKKIEMATIAIFGAIILSISFQTVFKLVPDPTLLEKRGLAALPEMHSFRDAVNDKFTEGMTNYANDNFGFRKIAIRLNNYLDVKLFQTTSNANVILGSESMLFGTNDWFSITKRHSTYTDSQIRDTSLKIKAFQNRLKSKGVEFLFVIAPDKSAIYPEHLPRHVYMRHAASERSRWYTALASAGVSYIDVEADILKAKNVGLTYYKGDHHWNHYASLIASQKMTDYLAVKLNAVAPILVTTGHKVDDHEKTGGGSLDEMLGVKASRVNMQPIVDVKGGKLPPGAAFGDSFIHWIYLDKVSENLISVADITNKGEAEIRQKLRDPKIRFLVVHIWEHSLPSFLSTSKVWDF